MAYKSNKKKQDEEADEGFEDLSSSALHEIRYGHLNQGFVEEETSRDDDDDVNPVSQSEIAPSRLKWIRQGYPILELGRLFCEMLYKPILGL